MKHFTTTFLIFLGSFLHAEQNPLAITPFGSFLHTERVPNALFFFSDIERSDSFQLRRALRTHDINIIVLASSGGSVWEGLQMAGIIFDKKITTYVPKLPDGEGCYSACAYMFFAGQNRLAAGELGVHQIGAYNAEADSERRKVGETQQATQFTTSEVIGFLNEFGTPPWVYERMFRSREIYAFTEKEKADLKQGQLDSSLSRSIDVFLGELRAELEKAAKAEPKTQTAARFDKSNKEMVKALQVLLNDAQCIAGVADGVWGRKTNDAAGRFAKSNKLSYSGPYSINRAFLEALASNTRKPCPKVETADIAGVWNTQVYCYSDKYRIILKNLKILRVGANRYTLYYQSPFYKDRQIKGYIKVSGNKKFNGSLVYYNGRRRGFEGAIGSGSSLEKTANERCQMWGSRHR